MQECSLWCPAYCETVHPFFIHLEGPVTFTLVAKCLTIFVLTKKVCRNRGFNPDLCMRGKSRGFPEELERTYIPVLSVALLPWEPPFSFHLFIFKGYFRALPESLEKLLLANIL